MSLQRILRASGAVLLFGLVLAARQLGVLLNVLFLFMAVAVCVSTVRTVLDVARRRASLSVYRNPASRKILVLGAALRALVWLCFAWALNLALVPAQFPANEVTQIRTVIGAFAAVLVLQAFVPVERKWSPADALYAALLALLGFDLWQSVREEERSERVTIASPFETPAIVFHGGPSPLLNHHSPFRQQASALDMLLLTPDGRVSSGDASQLGSYPCFGAPLLAPVSGRVAHVRGDLPDMPMGQTDRVNLAGNTISLATADGNYVLLAHLQAGSIQVAEGDHVEAGQRIARCGNSGNTSMPHLHLQVQNKPAFSPEDKELRTFPIAFTQAERVRGADVRAAPFSVRRNDVIRPL